MAGLQVGVSIPVAGAAVVAVEDLYEPHATLHEAPGDQKLLAERLRFVLLESKRAIRCCGFGFEVHGFGHSLLHLESELVAANASGQRGIVRIFNAGQAIQLAEQLELRGLLLAKHRLIWLRERQRIGRIGGKLNSRVLRTEIIRAMPLNTAAAVGERSSQDAERRQIVV